MIFETTLTRAEIAANAGGGWWRNKLFNDFLTETASAHPTRLALVDSHSRYTYGELSEAAEAAAISFLASGVHRGDVVSVQLPNWNEFVITTLALERIGAVINPIAPIFREREVLTMLRLAQPLMVVVPQSFRNFDYPSMYGEIKAQIPSIREMVVVGAESDNRWTGWDAFIENGRTNRHLGSVLDWLRPDPDDVVEVIFTSGTTGEPKGVLHTPNTIACAIDGVIKLLDLTSRDVCHMASTFAHQTGFLFGAHMPIQCGGLGIYQDVWDPERFVDLVQEFGITFSMGTTLFVRDTLQQATKDPSQLASLRTFICAGAPIPQSVAEEVARRLPTRLVPGWGMTENGLATAVFPADPAAKVTSSDGRPLAGMEVIVRDVEGRPCPPGVEGDLYSRGPFTFAGYLQGRKFTESSFDAEGWFNTGDRAYLDAEGFLRVSGRTKDIIIRAGENVPVKEIEDLILRHPAVLAVAIIAVPDERMGEKACACVILRPGAIFDLAALREYLRGEHLTPQYWPERLEVMTEFPTTPSGKVQKFLLKQSVVGS